MFVRFCLKSFAHKFSYKFGNQDPEGVLRKIDPKHDRIHFGGGWPGPTVKECSPWSKAQKSAETACSPWTPEGGGPDPILLLDMKTA